MRGYELAKVSANDCILASLVCGSLLQRSLPGITPLLRKSNTALSKGQYHRLVTPLFLHGGAAHLAMNAFALSNVGPECERWFGRGRLVCFFLVSGAGGNLASWALSPHPAVGASGAVFGLLGAWGVFLHENRRVLGRASVEAGLGALGRTVAANAALALAGGGQIDHAAHLGGLVVGAACGVAAGPRLRVAARRGELVLVDLARCQDAAGAAAHHAGRLLRRATATPRGRREVA